MRSGLSQAQEQALMRSAPEIIPPPGAAPMSKELHYDQVATFPLTGLRGNRVQDVMNISIEGAFVAVAIGYSFIAPSTLVVGAAIDGVTGLADFLPQLTKSLLVRLTGIDFKYSIVDSGTGRELQNKPIHNIAGLGEATGDRPFRPLAKPMLFMPRSTIRIEVEEISEGPLYDGALLYIVLHGYKILGYGTALP